MTIRCIAAAIATGLLLFSCGEEPPPTQSVPDTIDNSGSGPHPVVLAPAAGDTVVSVGATVVWQLDSAVTGPVWYALYVKKGNGAYQTATEGAGNYGVLDSAILAGTAGSSISLKVRALIGADTAWSAERALPVRTPRNGEDVIMFFPNGGEIIDGTAEWEVRWWARDYEVPSVVILISANGGVFDNLFTEEVSRDTELWGRYPVAPADLSAPGSAYRIRVQSYMDSEKHDTSEKTFTLCTSTCP